jgi:CRP-like cAMP-binding protein
MNDTTGAVAAPPENRILRAVPVEERSHLDGLLYPVALPARTVLFEPGQVIRAVHFPLDGVISLVTPMCKGDTVEVATIGNEGVVGVPLVAGGSLAVRAISQVGGLALRMDADAFMAELDQLPGFRLLMRRYTQALFGQISQAAACNRLHSNEERLSRWLLMSHDRVAKDTFAISYDFLGQMLGASRATLTLSAGQLQAAGLIRYQRGRLTIVDRKGLETVSCDCYGIIKAVLAQAVAPPVAIQVG